MKKILLVLALISSSLIPISVAQAGELPKVLSFDFSPKEIELTSRETTVNFELVVSHPNGIENTSTIVTATGPRNSSVSGYLNRVNQIGIFDSKPVTFKGSLVFSRTISEGAYSIKVEGISNINSTGYRYTTSEITPANFRNLVGAESSLIVRLMGDANIAYNMFSGPTYDTLGTSDFKDTSKYNRQITPILRVGESYLPLDYFESYVPSVPLRISTSTPNTCTSDGTTMKFVSTGNCQFKVFTNKTKDYLAQSSEQSVTVENARAKSTLFVSEVAPESARELPKTITLPQVYGAASGYVLPVSTTPEICFTTAYTVRLISGGTCTLIYQTPATSDYLASEIYKQNIEVIRDPQTLLFEPVKSISLSQKTLNLSSTASSGAPVSFVAVKSKACSITGNVLTLLSAGNCEVVASQAGTSIFAPVSVTRSITVTSANKQSKAATCAKRNKGSSNSKKSCPKGIKKPAK